MPASDYLKPSLGTRGASAYLGKREPEEPEKLLEQYGYQVPKEKGWSLLGKKFVNVLGGVLNVLRSGEYAIGGMLAGKSPITGIREKISPSEVLFQDREEDRKLWSQKGLAALSVDILLDPITYLTFGAGGAMKLSTKGGQVLINKSGRKLMRTMINKGVSEAAARRTMARVIQEGGESAAKKYIGKEGLKFMGQVFIPLEGFQKAGKVANMIPGAGAVNKVGRGFARAFKPFSEIDMMTAKIGGKGTYVDNLYKPYDRETQAEIFKSIDEIKKISKNSWDTYKKDIGSDLAYAVEKGELTGDNFIDTITKAYQRDAKSMLDIEWGLGKKIGKIDNYLRHYLSKEGRQWMDKGNNFSSALPKPLKAKLEAAKPRKIEGTIKEINEHFQSKYGVKNFFEPDFFKAWAIRKAEHIKFVNTHKFVEQTKARLGVRLDKAKITIVDGIKLVEPTNPQLKGWLLPQPIVKHLDDTLKMLTQEDTMKGFVGFYDKALSIWKGHVTGWHPAFHTRNFIGGSFNNWLAGVKAVDNTDTWKILLGSDDVIKTQIGTEYTGKQILDLADRFGVRGQPGMIDVYRQVNQAIEEITARNIKKAAIKTSNAPRFVMEFVEDKLRLPLFINRLKKGYSPAEAAKDVFKFHFDYVPTTGLTDFERLYMRRLIPFYVWTRNNIPLQMEQMMKQPGKYANLEKLRQSMFGKKEMEEFQYLPDWMKEMFIAPLPWKDEAGKTLWAQLDLPLEDINKLPISSSGIREIASMLTPFLKFPIERYMNRNFYFGGDMWNPELPREMQTRKTTEALKVLPNPIKKYLNFREVKYRDWRYPDEKRFIKRYEIDARKLHIIQTLIGRYYSTLKGVFDEDIPNEWKVSRFVGGVPVRSFDIKEEADRREAEQERQTQEMMKWLKQHNIIPYKKTKKTGASKYLQK